MERNNILVVDDEAGIRDILKRRLEYQGFMVDVASGGFEAFAMVQASVTGFDLVISDIRMPEGSGLELLDRITAMENGPAVILVTGFADCDEELVKARGGYAFLSKPLRFEHLVKVCEEALAREVVLEQ